MGFGGVRGVLNEGYGFLGIVGEPDFLSRGPAEAVGFGNGSGFIITVQLPHITDLLKDGTAQEAFTKDMTGHHLTNGTSRIDVRVLLIDLRNHCGLSISRVVK